MLTLMDQNGRHRSKPVRYSNALQITATPSVPPLKCLKTTCVANVLDRLSQPCSSDSQQSRSQMQSQWSQIALISRTIGAERGRAARGRPV